MTALSIFFIYSDALGAAHTAAVKQYDSVGADVVPLFISEMAFLQLHLLAHFSFSE